MSEQEALKLNYQNLLQDTLARYEQMHREQRDEIAYLKNQIRIQNLKLAAVAEIIKEDTIND